MFTKNEDMLRYGAMAVDHLFIREYLPGARGDDIKVYLYGLYLCQHPVEGLTLEEVAHALNMEVSEVDASLRYWERRRLVRRLRDNPPEYEFRTALQAELSGENALEVDPEYADFERDLLAQFDNTNRHITPAEVAQAWDWVLDPRMRLPREIVLMLISHMKATGGVNFKFSTAEKEALRLCQEKITTVEEAESYFSHSVSIKENARKVLIQLGKRRTPSQNELDLYRKWTGEWGYTPEAILAACGETTKGEPTFAYLDGILKGMRERNGQQTGSRTGSDVTRQLSDEKKENDRVREFANSLGFRKATAMLRKTYERLCGEYGAEIVHLVADETYRAGGDVEMAEHTMERLRKQGLTTLEAVQAYFEEAHRLNAALAPILERCGQRGAPTVGDRTLYTKWVKEWGFSEEMLLIAAGHARSYARKMPAIDRILSDWRKSGITRPEQAAAYKPAFDGGKQVTAQQYDQRRYTESELEKRTEGV